jgi:hypothetical protein
MFDGGISEVAFLVDDGGGDDVGGVVVGFKDEKKMDVSGGVFHQRLLSTL